MPRASPAETAAAAAALLAPYVERAMSLARV
jgi:hypothetical protein